MHQGIKIVAPAELAPELGERLWDWASRNLFWLLRDAPEALDWLDTNLAGVRGSVQPATPRGRLFATKPRANAAAARAARWLTLSASSLRPGLDELLERYGARLAPRPPSIEELAATCGDEDTQLVDRLGRAPLVLVPNDPGEPARPTRFACVFHIDEWPLTAVMEPLLEVDLRVRGCVCWIHPTGPGTPRVFDAIPEMEDPDARPAGLFALLAHYTPMIWQKPLAWLGETPNMTRAFHANASRDAVERFFVAEGFRLLSVAEVLALQRVWASIEHGRLARVGHDPEPWTRPELWTDTFPPRRTAPERQRLRARVRAEQSLLRQVSFGWHRAFDGFAVVRDALVEAGMKRPEVFAAMVPVLLCFMNPGSWLWHLVAGIREDAAVRKALVRAGFTRCHLAHVRQLWAAALHKLSVDGPSLDMECAEIATPDDLSPDVAAVLRGAFPILATRYAIHLDACSSSDDGALTGQLTLTRWEDDQRITALGGRSTTLLTAEQRRSTVAAEALRARAEALGALSSDAFDAMFSEGQEDPFQPFEPSLDPALARLFEELLPGSITLSDGRELSLRRLSQTAQGVFATFTVTTRDAEGHFVSSEEYGDRRVLGPRELKGAAARRALSRKVATWEAASGEMMRGALQS